MTEEIFETKDGVKIENFALEVRSEIDEYVNGLRPGLDLTYDYGTSQYIETPNSDLRLRHYEKGKLAIDAMKHIVSSVRGVAGNIFELCYYLNVAFLNYRYIEGSITLPGSQFKGGLSQTDFESFIEKLGVSKSTAYRYRELGELVDIERKRFIPELEGYSFSLINEMITIIRSRRYSSSMRNDIVSLTQIIPAGTTIERITKYKKILELKRKHKEPFSYYSNEDGSLRNKIFDTTPLDEALEIYEEWERGKAKDDLEEVMSGKGKGSESENKPLVRDERIEELEREISALKLCYVPELGMCDGCKYKGVNLNKCRCCKRNKDMKDLYERG